MIPKGRNVQAVCRDLWLEDVCIYHPINVKTGVVGSEGQPNLVSLKKVFRAIMDQQIDSYYLLIVKMNIHETGITPHVYFFDMLDWLDYVTFDAGPGQMMLKAISFFDDYIPHKSKNLDINAKVYNLMALYEDGEKRLSANRARDRKLFMHKLSAFQKAGPIAVTPETQKDLNLQ